MVSDKQLTHPILAKFADMRVLGKSPASLFLRLNQWIWKRLPSRVRGWSLVRAYGRWLHTLVCVRSRRQQAFGTFFLRNRPALELMRRLADNKPEGASMKISVMGCSIGAEVYSILWTLRRARPDLKIALSASDISKEILMFAERGEYSPDTFKLVYASIFERLDPDEMREMFDWDRDRARVKSWLRDGIAWLPGNAGDPELVRILGPQDIVVASNFLCHMAPADSETCLRNIAQLVAPGGYLFVSGVDLDVRSKVALDLNWEPVRELLAEIHDGDPSVRNDWPWQWWGLEPLDRRGRDWQTRYAAVFRIAGQQNRTQEHDLCEKTASCCNRDAN